MADFRLIREELFRNRAIMRGRVFRDRNNPLDSLTDQQLLSRYRFSRNGIMFLCDILEDKLGRITRRSFAIPVCLQVKTALYYLACGSYQRVISDCEYVPLSQSSVCRIIRSFVHELSGLSNFFIKFPRRRRDFSLNHQKFYEDHKIPNIIGLIDGTQIQIIAPRDNEDVYVNRHHYHSINTQIVCDYDCKIINVVAKWPGSVHDSTIYQESGLQEYLQAKRNEGFPQNLFLGDSGYACSNWLLTPFRNVNGRKEELFNRIHKSCRSKVERTIGQLKRRWSCIQQQLRTDPVNACKIIGCTVILHNLAKELNMPDVAVDAVEIEQNATVPYNGEEETALRDFITRNL